MTPLRQRYIDDLRLKNFSPNTIKVYVHSVEKFARHFGRSPQKLGFEEVPSYLVHLVHRGLSRGRHPRAALEESVPQGRHYQACEHAHVASQFRDPSPRSWHKPACDPASLGTRQDSNHGPLDPHFNGGIADRTKSDGNAGDSR